MIVTLALALVPAAGTSPAASAKPAPLNLRWLQMLNSVHGYALSGQNPDAYRCCEPTMVAGGGPTSRRVAGQSIRAAR